MGSVVRLWGTSLEESASEEPSLAARSARIGAGNTSVRSASGTRAGTEQRSAPGAMSAREKTTAGPASGVPMRTSGLGCRPGESKLTGPKDAPTVRAGSRAAAPSHVLRWVHPQPRGSPIPSKRVNVAPAVKAAIIPFGAPIVFVVAALLLLAQGAVASAVCVLAFGCFVLAVADHVVRPVLIGGATKLPFLWVLLGILGGVET